MTDAAAPSYRVLVVDDDEVDRAAVRRLLVATLPCTIEERARAADVRVEGGGYDCVLLDFQLPDADGLQVLRRLRSESPDLPVIMLTGHGDEQLAVELMKAGASDYVAKRSLSGDRLAASIRQAVRAARAERVARRLGDERQQLLQREREARKQAEAASAAKDQFLAMVSHELRTPLNAILGWARILRTGGPAVEAKLVQGLETIERNAKVQAQLIEDLLDVSRIISGKLMLDVQPTDPGTVVAHALDAVRVQAQVRGIELDQDVAPCGPIMADAGRLQQVVWNLLSNAIKFTPRGGRVTVSLSRTSEGIEIVVRDQGQGIAPEFLPHVFDRFAQAEGARRHGGLGLGLAIVKHLVEQHGGRIEAASDGIGKGAAFTVRLPAVAATGAVRETPVPDAETMRLAGVRVLIVDDDDDTREVVAEILAHHGAQIETRATTDEALLSLGSRLPDVLVSDIEMPGRDGYALIRALRELRGRASSLPAVALTGAARVEDRIRTLAAGYQMHVPKPVDPDELVAAVAALARGENAGATVDPLPGLVS